MEFGSNTTEKFQNSLKNLKTHEAQPSEFSNFSVSFEIFPWCLKAKFQIPPLRRRMFVINTTTVLLQVPRFVSVWQLESYFLATTWLAGEISGVWEKVRFQIFPWCLSQTPLQNLFFHGV